MHRLIARGNLLALGVLVICVILTSMNIHSLRRMQQDFMSIQPQEISSGSADEERSVLSLAQRPKYAVFGKNIDSGYLKHVYSVLDRAGYVRVNYNLSDDWSVLWAHDYPFTKIKPVLLKMKRHQRVNKFPGSGFVTNKVNLATSKLPNVPRAFQIPQDASELTAHAAANPDKMFVQKNKNHRGIKIEKIGNLDLSKEGSFVQEFVDDPFLIDGYKFDIGIYTMITSMEPLRIHVFEGDVLLRFCPEKYHPFDAANRDKYVVHDDYRPTWKVPTMAKYYSDLGFSFKETLNTHVRSLGEDPDKIWSAAYDTIREVYKNQQVNFVNAIGRYPHKRAFFEMVRFDFVVDSKLQIYLMEANMSPNLSSKHFALNRRLYEQVMYSLLRLAGVVRGGIFSSSLQPGSEEETEMQVKENIM
jgi:tubulin monoglycylase TTLL15